MIVLKLIREINEVVMVGDDVQVKVLAVEGEKVLLGFKAPKKIIVHREEVYRRIRNQQVWSTNVISDLQTKFNPFLGGK